MMRSRGRGRGTPTHAGEAGENDAKKLWEALPRAQTILALVAIDRTFLPARRHGGGQESLVWAGKCIHCRAALIIDPERPEASAVTVEHIVPRSLGGQHRPDNLALSCARCNHLKGSRQDPKGLQDARLLRLIERLQHERKKRLRAPHIELLLPKICHQWLHEPAS